MCEHCGCEAAEMKIQYKCDCGDEQCDCNSIIGFEEEPQSIPHCCGKPMKRIK